MEKKTVGDPEQNRKTGWEAGTITQQGCSVALSQCVGPRSGRPGGSPNANSIAAGMGVDRERVTDIRLEQLKGWNMPFTKMEKILRKAYLGEKDPKLGVLNVDYLRDTVYLGNIRVLIVLCDTLH